MKSVLTRNIQMSIVVLIAAVFFCSAQESEKRPDLSNKVEVTGYGSWVFGQIVKGTDDGITSMTTIDHYWSHEVYAGIGFKGTVNERFKLNAGLEGKVWHPYSSNGNPQIHYHRKYNALWLDQSNGTYDVGDLENPWLTVTLGYFKYKYNPEARNLGEQLFRSVAYPGIIMDYFDFPAVRLLGSMAQVNLFEGKVKADAMIISESDWEPFGDFSFALLASYSPLRAIDIGGGVELARLFPVASSKTTPRIQRIQKDAAGNVVPVGTDSSYYTFKATKLMGRLTLDPKTLFNLPFFGPEDAKLYGEINVLGLKDYSFWYEDISRRMPFMFGFNFPAFKVLDLLSIELENYKYPFQTGYFNMINNYGGPLPDNANNPSGWDPALYTYDDWKWSVYVKKTIFSGFSITAQFARDHMHTTYFDGYPYWIEAVSRPGQWWWRAKFCYSL